MGEFDEHLEDELEDTGELYGRRRIVRSDAVDDTGSFESIERIARVETDAQAQPMVYGLAANLADEKRKRERANTIRMIVAAVLAVLVFLGILLVARPFSRDDASQAPEEEFVADDQAQDAAEAQDDQTRAMVVEDPKDPEDDGLLKAEDIAELVQGLTFAGADISVSPSDVEVVLAGRRATIYHTVEEGTGLDPNLVAGRGAQRAASLANLLAVVPAVLEDGNELPLADITWVVRNRAGEAYLAVYYPVGGAPTEGDGIAVLRQSTSYRLSNGLFAALGSWFEQSVGNDPTLPDGTPIAATAAWVS